MTVNLLLFAGAKERVGSGQLTVVLDEPCTVGQLKKQLASTHPELEDLISRSTFSVEQKYAADQTPISENDEVAMIPPVSGG